MATNAITQAIVTDPVAARQAVGAAVAGREAVPSPQRAGHADRGDQDQPSPKVAEM